MNYYLIDTHILLWWISNDKLLSKKIKNLINKPDNYIMVSTVSIWEIIVKKSQNKLKAPDNLLEILDKHNIEVLDITADHVLYLKNLPLIHNDPFDKLLIAQAIVEDLALVTEDKIIPEYNVNIFK